MEVRISVLGGDPVTELESLGDWLEGEFELAGQIRLTGSEPRSGELGAAADVLVIMVGSGGALSVLASSLKAWLSQPRRSDVCIRVQGKDGRRIEIAARRVDEKRIDVLLRQALGREDLG